MSAAVGADFPIPAKTDWEELVAKTTEKSLDITTYDGFKIQPLYDRTDLPDISPVPGARDIEVSQPVVWSAKPKAVNEELKTIAEEGADRIWLKTPGSLSPKDFSKALDGLDLSVALGPGTDQLAEAEAFLEFLQQGEQRHSGSRRYNLGLDPIGVLARYGGLAHKPEHAFVELARLAQAASSTNGSVSAAKNTSATSASAVNVSAINIDTTIYANGGATEAEQLSFALATGVQYIREMLEAGCDIDTAISNIEFSFAATPKQFKTIALFRAMRLCWRQVALDCGASPKNCSAPIHAITSEFFITRDDPWVNLLRAAVSCFGAIIGGAASVTVLPLDWMWGQPETLTRQLAANTSIILKEESKLGKVLDPGEGSYYLESLTKDLADAGWQRFQEIEAEGTMLDLLTSQKLHKILDASWQNLLKDLATRKEPITGVSDFPDLKQAPLERSPWPQTELQTEPQGSSGSKTSAFSVQPVSQHRRSAPYEELRDKASDKMLTVFLANLGAPAQHLARSNFAGNFFEAAGIEVVSNSGFEDMDSLGRAFKESGSAIAVCCGADEQYKKMLSGAVAALTNAGCEQIYLAAKPSEEYKQTGVKRFIFQGEDVLGVLRDIVEASPKASPEAKSGGGR